MKSLVNIESYLASDADLSRDMDFCSIGGETAGLIRTAAAGILRSERMLADLKLIDDAFDADDCAARVGHLCADEYPRQDGDAAGAFLLAFPVLRRVGRLRAFYAAHSIPEEYARALMEDLPRWIETYSDWNPGRRGFSQVFWLREHVLGHIFQIGRLQFQPWGWYLDFTPITDGRGNFALLANPGDRVARTGQFASSEGVNQEGAVDIILERGPDGMRGHRVVAGGKVSPVPELFASGTWREAFERGAPVLNVHIPSGAPLAPDACAESFARAPEFFARHFPGGTPAKAMVCTSWLLSPELATILPPDSNILAFQRFFTTFPLRRTSGAQIYERVFFPYGRSVTRDKLRTRLQKAIFEYVEAGGIPLEGGGAIFLR